MIFVKRDLGSERDTLSHLQQQDGRWRWVWRRIRQGAIALFIALLMLMLFPSAVNADVDETIADPADNAEVAPAQLFEMNCAGCHANGGNIIRRGKTLKLRSLQRNRMDSVDAIKTIVTQGKNNMSAYGDRLSPAEIEAVAVYVWQQAQADWPRK